MEEVTRSELCSQILAEIDQFPKESLTEVLDFVQFVKLRRLRENLQPAVASESSLGKDWLQPEEDVAWRNL